MNRKNKFTERKKERLLLEHKEDIVCSQIRNQGLIKLDKPIPHGWIASWKLRDDIANREDRWVFDKVLELVNQPVKSRNKDFKVKLKKGKTYQTLLPGKKSITKDVYDDLHPAVQKHFHLDYYQKHRFRTYYSCTITYEFVVDIERDYITHRREQDRKSVV